MENFNSNCQTNPLQFGPKLSSTPIWKCIKISHQSSRILRSINGKSIGDIWTIDKSSHFYLTWDIYHRVKPDRGNKWHYMYIRRIFSFGTRIHCKHGTWYKPVCVCTPMVIYFSQDTVCRSAQPPAKINKCRWWADSGGFRKRFALRRIEYSLWMHWGVGDGLFWNFIGMEKCDLYLYRARGIRIRNISVADKTLYYHFGLWLHE